MNRRHFLRALTIGAGAAAATQFEPIRTYFFAPTGGWRSMPITPAMAKAIAHPLTFHKDAFSMVMDPLSGVQMKTVNYRGDQKRSPLEQYRVDVLYGMSVLEPKHLMVAGVPVEENADIDPTLLALYTKDLAAAIDRDALREYEKWMRRVAILKDING